MIFELIIIAVLVIGISLFLWEYGNSLRWITHSRPLVCRRDRHRQDCMICSHVKKCLHHLHKQARWLHRHPELSGEILYRLKHLLPSGIIFKEQRARLYNLAEHIHKSHIHSLKQNHRYSPEYSGLSRHINIQLQKLNRIASEQENRIDNLHRIAEHYTVAQHYTKLHHCTKAAIRLQHINRKLLKNIHQTEKYLSAISKKIRTKQAQYRHYPVTTKTKHLNR